MDDMAPQNYMLRVIDKAINWNFIYDLVEEKYCPDNGRTSIDSVMLIKFLYKLVFLPGGGYNTVIKIIRGGKNMRKRMNKIVAGVMTIAMVATGSIQTFAATNSCDHESTDYTNYTKEPTCTDEGRGDLVCMDCDEILERDVAVPAIGHSFAFAKVTKTPTQTETGIEAGILTETCDRCGATEDVKLTKLPSTCGHENTGSFNYIEETCTTDGYSNDEICLDCGKYVEKGEIIKAPGHVWYDEPTEETEATCTTDGQKVYPCWNCDEKKVETIKATGHSYGEFQITKEVTCENDGEKEAVCSKCGDVKKEIIKATGHQWNDGDITTRPTTTSTGVKTFTCSVCGNTKTEEIAKLPEENNPQQPATPDNTKKDDGKNDNTKPSDPKKDNTTVVTPAKPAVNTAKVGTKFVVSGQTYKITKAGKEVSFIQAKKNANRIVIPATVKNKGITYKVTSIVAKAVKNNKKVKSVSIGTNIKKISNNAFYKCPALKTVAIKSVLLTKKNVSKKAFKGIHKKMVIKVPKKVKKSYAKIFKGLKVK